MKWFFLPFPSYCVTEGLVFAATLPYMYEIREEFIFLGNDVKQVNNDVYALENLPSNMIAMGVMAVLSIIFLFLVESDIFQCCSKCSCFRQPQPKTDLEYDDDVLEEH